MRVADGKAVTVLGSIPVIVRRLDGVQGKVTLLLHVVEELSDLYLSKRCLIELGVIDKSFPFPEKSQGMLKKD